MPFPAFWSALRGQRPTRRRDLGTLDGAPPQRRLSRGWWSGAIVLPLWLGWVTGSLGSLQTAQLVDTRADAEALASIVRAQLGPDAFAGGSVLVTLTGHACSCIGDAEASRWAQALQSRSADVFAVDAPGAAYSTLAFDADGRLRFAGSPVGAGCSGDPARLLAAALATARADAAPFLAPCVC